jgi:hypothetical protein
MADTDTERLEVEPCGLINAHDSHVWQKGVKIRKCPGLKRTLQFENPPKHQPVVKGVAGGELKIYDTSLKTWFPLSEASDELKASVGIIDTDRGYLMEEGTKFDEGKLPLDLWSPYAIEETARVLAFGAIKYEPHNWAKGISYRRVFGALLRHLWAFWRGEEYDDEWGLHHLAHAMCCLMFLLHYEVGPKDYTQFDDRYKYVED